MTSGSLWNYYRDKIDDVDVNDSASDDKPFEYKTKVVEKDQKDHHNLENQETQTDLHNHWYHP